MLFNSFYNDKAILLMDWYFELCQKNIDITKLIRIYRAACKMEYNYRIYKYGSVDVNFLNFKPLDIELIQLNYLNKLVNEGVFDYTNIYLGMELFLFLVKMK